jgi:hypothetical protein
LRILMTKKSSKEPPNSHINMLLFLWAVRKIQSDKNYAWRELGSSCLRVFWPITLVVVACASTREDPKNLNLFFGKWSSRPTPTRDPGIQSNSILSQQPSVSVFTSSAKLIILRFRLFSH